MIKSGNMPGNDCAELVVLTQCFNPTPRCSKYKCKIIQAAASQTIFDWGLFNTAMELHRHEILIPATRTDCSQQLPRRFVASGRVMLQHLSTGHANLDSVHGKRVHAPRLARLLLAFVSDSRRSR